MCWKQKALIKSEIALKLLFNHVLFILLYPTDVIYCRVHSLHFLLRNGKQEPWHEFVWLAAEKNISIPVDMFD